MFVNDPFTLHPTLYFLGRFAARARSVPFHALHVQPISHSPLSVRTWTTKLKSTCRIAGLSNQDCEHGEEQDNFHGDEQYESNQDDVRDREDEEETEDLGRFDSGQRYLRASICLH
jgi:hypothetical protein